MTHIEENNKLLEYILKTKIFNSDSPFNLNLIFSTTHPVFGNCKFCLNKSCESDGQISEKLVDNTSTILNYLKQNNYYKDTITLTIGNAAEINYLDTVVDFYKDYKLSRVIELKIDYRALTDELQAKLQNYIIKFNSLDVDIIFNIIVQNSHDLLSDEIKFVTQYKGSILNYVLNIDTLENIINIDDQLDTLFAGIKVIYIEDFEDWAERQFKLYGEFLEYKIQGTAINAYNTLYLNEKYKIFRLNLFNKLDCDAQETLNIQMQSLAIVPCAGIQDSKFIYGYIKSDLSVEAKNVELASMLYFANTNTMLPSCDVCAIKVLCPKGCISSNFNLTRDLFLPNLNYCCAIKNKLDILSKHYSKSGLQDYIMSLQS